MLHTRKYKARNRVVEILKNEKKIDLAGIMRGKYFRIVATIVADGQNVNQLLIDEGLARHYSGREKRKGWC